MSEQPAPRQRGIVLTPRQRQVLAWVRLHPDARTDDMAIALGLSVPVMRSTLLILQRRKLVGRQEPLLKHEVVSTWRATEMETK